jgi:hypothetical protein
MLSTSNALVYIAGLLLQNKTTANREEISAIYRGVQEWLAAILLVLGSRTWGPYSILPSIEETRTLAPEAIQIPPHNSSLFVLAVLTM